MIGLPLLTPNPKYEQTISSPDSPTSSQTGSDHRHHDEKSTPGSNLSTPRSVPMGILKSAFEAAASVPIVSEGRGAQSESDGELETASPLVSNPAVSSAPVLTSPMSSLNFPSQLLQHTTASESTKKQILPKPNQAFIRPSSPVKLERDSSFPSSLSPVSTGQPSQLVNQSWSLDSQRMPPPAVPQFKRSQPSESSLGKRKAPNIHAPSSSSNAGDDDDAPSIPPSSRQRRDINIISHRDPSEPIPILPTPIPSRRFKKHQTSRQVLIPTEQLPVFPLPPLPVIPDADLLKQVFTHQSLFEWSKGIFETEDDKPVGHYEKLEHVGDSILGMIVTTWLHEIRPNLTIGTATKLKAHLVSNATLSHLSGLYNFPQRLNGDPDLLQVLRAQTDVRAALVEAYIAALYFSYPASDRLTVALPIIDAWLREMYDPLQDFFYTYMRTEYDQYNAAAGADIEGNIILLAPDEMARIDSAAQGMHPLLQMYCNTQERELRYEEEKYDTSLGLLWKLTVLVDGIELGEATRSVRKMAKNVAAWEAAKKLGLTADSTSAGAALF